MPIKEDQIHAEEKSEQEKREQEADERLTKKTYLYIWALPQVLLFIIAIVIVAARVPVPGIIKEKPKQLLLFSFKHIVQQVFL